MLVLEGLFHGGINEAIRPCLEPVDDNATLSPDAEVLEITVARMEARDMIRHAILKTAVSLLALGCSLVLAVGCADDEGGTSGTSSSSSSSEQWFQGGTLHGATAAQWKSGTYQNKLATAADWLAATIWKGHLKSPSDFDRVKVKAQMLVTAVDEVVAGEQPDSLQASEIAAALITMSNDLGP